MEKLYKVRVTRVDPEPEYTIMTSFNTIAPNESDAHLEALKLYQEQFSNNIDSFQWETHTLSFSEDVECKNCQEKTIAAYLVKMSSWVNDNNNYYCPDCIWYDDKNRLRLHKHYH